MSDESQATSPMTQRTTVAPRHAHHGRLVAVAVLLGGLNLWRYGTYLLDDTFISFRYARNLVAGNGLVFNVGERVEGYTNFLFVLLAAGCVRLGIDPIAGTKVVSLCCMLLLVVTMVRIARRFVDTDHSVLTVALLIPLPGIAYWAAASFETMLFAALMLVALWLLLLEHERRQWRGAAAVFVLLALTRPEGVFLFGVASIMFLVAARFEPSALRRFVINVGLFGLAYGTYFVWRYSYYGDLLPNTFRAKVTGGPEQVLTGLAYLGGWARTYPLMAAALLLPLASLSSRGRQAMRRSAEVLALFGIAAAYAMYVTLVGGDFMPFHRFFVPLLPLCCIIVTWAFGAVPAAWRSLVVLIVFAVHVTCGYLTEEPYRAFVAHRTAVVGQRVGERLAQQLAPDDLIAVNTAGALPYFSQRPAVDMLGLTDAAIAHRPVFIVSSGWAGHRRGWGAYVLDRKPRAVFFYNAAGSREPFYLGDHELADNPYFRFFYSARVLTVPPPASDTIVGRFIGYPFGFDASLQAPWRDLGLESRFEQHPFAYTVLSEGQTVATYFAFDARDDALWALRQPEDVDAFIAIVISSWTARAQPDADPVARQRVDALCTSAFEKIQQGDTATAKRLLSVAAQQNETARSPLVYQYIANVAVLDDDLFTAVAAQKEALRLAPENDLYRRNLISLLKRPLMKEKRTGLRG